MKHTLRLTSHVLHLTSCFLLLISYLTGCGYHIAGRGSHVQSEVKSISIPVFENKTMEPIVEEEITPAVIKGFLKDSRIVVVDRSQADLVLHGSVTSYSETPLSFDKNQNVLEYRISVTTHLKLLRQSTNTISWERDLNAYAEYKVSSDVMSTKNLRFLALKEIAQNLAEEATDRVLLGW